MRARVARPVGGVDLPRVYRRRRNGGIVIGAVSSMESSASRESALDIARASDASAGTPRESSRSAIFASSRDTSPHSRATLSDIGAIAHREPPRRWTIESWHLTSPPSVRTVTSVLRLRPYSRSRSVYVASIVR